MFGESAGGMSVHMLLTSPAAKGLLHKAIIESGGGRSGLLPGAQGARGHAERPPSAESVGVAFAKSVGIEGTDAAALAALRKVPADKVIAGLNLASMGGRQRHLRRRADDRRADHGRDRPRTHTRPATTRRCRCMVGANSLDIGFSFAKTMDEVMAQFGADKDKALAAYDPDKSGDLRAVGYKVAMDRDDDRAGAVHWRRSSPRRASRRTSIASRTWPSRSARRRRARRTPPRSRSCSTR